MANGQHAFQLVQEWTGQPLGDLADACSWLITSHGLSVLDSTSKLTAQGGVGGGTVEDHPLRVALSNPRPLRQETTETALLALGALAQWLSPEAPQAKRIATAINNQESSAWSRLLAELPSPRNVTPSMYLASLQRRCGELKHATWLRPTEKSFLNEVTKSASLALTHLDEVAEARRRSSVILEQRLEADDDEGQATLETREVFWQIDPPELGTGGEPIVTAYAADPTPPDEIDQEVGSPLSRNQLRASFRSATENQFCPYHWHSLSPPEINFALREAFSSMGAGGPQDRAAGIIVLLALVLGKTPVHASLISVATQKKPGHICLRTGCYVRKVPRPPQGWAPSAHHRDLQPVAETIDLVLPSSIVQSIRKLYGGGSQAVPMWQLAWPNADSCSEHLQAWLTSRKSQHRLTPRRIARVIRNEIFSVQGRLVADYWLFQSEADPPPSGAYYGALPVRLLRDMHFDAWSRLFDESQLAVKTARPRPIDGIVGSYLQLPLTTVEKLCAHLRNGIEATTGGSSRSVIHAHNRYVAYTVTLLNFATAHRPIKDPFDALDTISIRRGYVLLDDKHIDGTHSSRLVPLVPYAVEQLSRYLNHLERLSSAIALIAPETSHRIKAHLASPSKRLLPTFFFLSKDAKWESVQPVRLATYFPDFWNYPANTHRHFVASQLSLRGVDEFAINQLLGHLDAGTASISRLSIGAPDVVFSNAKAAIGELLTEAGFLPLDSPLPQATPEQTGGRVGAGSLVVPTFGRELRAELRRAVELREIVFVRNLVDQLLASKPEGSPPNDKDVRALVAQVKNKSVTTDFRYDRVRMDALRDYLEEIRKKTEAKFFVPRPILVLNNDEGFFEPQALRDADIFDELQAEFVTLLSNLHAPLSAINRTQRKPPNTDKRAGKRSDAPVSNADAIAESARRFTWGVLSFVIVARLADLKVIRSQILKGRYRVHAGQGERTLLEYAVNDFNVKRLPIDTITAALLQPVPTECPDEATIDSELRLILEKLQTRVLGRGRGSALARLCQVADAHNRVSLPGQAASYLSGDCDAVSVPFSVWLKSVHHRVDPEQNEEDSRELEPGGTSKAPTRETNLLVVASSATNTSAEVFCKAITSAVSNANRKHNLSFQPPKDETGASKITQDRIDRFDATVRSLHQEGHVAPIGGLAASWLRHLMVHGSVEGPVVLHTVERYWAGLKRDVVPLAYKLTFEEIAAGALEDVYSTAIDVVSQHQEFTRKICGLFHRYLVDEFKVAEVDWNEVLPEGYVDASSVVSAGVVLEETYHTILDLLLSDPQTPNRQDRDSAALLVLLMFRFGLRTSEAMGLLLRDVFLHQGRYFIRVAPNFSRKIKTDAGVRVVPQMETFAAIESELLHQFLNVGKAVRSHDALATLLAGDAHTRDLSHMHRVAARAADAIRIASGERTYSLYTLRHSYASRMHAQLSLPAHRNAAALPLPQIKHGEGLNRLLAIIMGHASPTTTHRHYCHFFDDIISAQNIDLRNSQRLLQIIGCNASGQFIRGNQPCPTALKEYPLFSPPSSLNTPRVRPSSAIGPVAVAVKYFRLLSYGHAKSTLAQLLQISEAQLNKMNAALSGLCDERPIRFVGHELESRGSQSDETRLRAEYWEQLTAAARLADKMFDSPGARARLNAYAESWAKYVVSIDGDFLINPLSDPGMVTALLQTVQVAPADFVFGLNPADQHCDWYADAIRELGKHGAELVEALRLARPATQVGRTHFKPRACVLLRRTSEGVIRNTRQFSVLVASIWLAMHAIEEN